MNSWRRTQFCDFFFYHTYVATVEHFILFIFPLAMGRRRLQLTSLSHTGRVLLICEPVWNFHSKSIKRINLINVCALERICVLCMPSLSMHVPENSYSTRTYIYPQSISNILYRYIYWKLLQWTFWLMIKIVHRLKAIKRFTPSTIESHNLSVLTYKWKFLGHNLYDCMSIIDAYSCYLVQRDFKTRSFDVCMMSAQHPSRTHSRMYVSGD